MNTILPKSNETEISYKFILEIIERILDLLYKSLTKDIYQDDLSYEIGLFYSYNAVSSGSDCCISSSLNQPGLLTIKTKNINDHNLIDLTTQLNYFVGPSDYLITRGENLNIIILNLKNGTVNMKNLARYSKDDDTDTLYAIEHVLGNFTIGEYILLMPQNLGSIYYTLKYINGSDNLFSIEKPYSFSNLPTRYIRAFDTQLGNKKKNILLSVIDEELDDIKLVYQDGLKLEGTWQINSVNLYGWCGAIDVDLVEIQDTNNDLYYYTMETRRNIGVCYQTDYKDIDFNGFYAFGYTSDEVDENTLIDKLIPWYKFLILPPLP